VLYFAYIIFEVEEKTMIKLLKFLLKATIIALIGQEALATKPHIEAQYCPSHPNDTSHVAGAALFESGIIELQDTGELAGNDWLLENAYAVGRHAVHADGSYKFIGAHINNGESPAVVRCDYECDPVDGCEPRINMMTLKSTPAKDSSGKKPKTAFIASDGLWFSESQPTNSQGRRFTCGTSDVGAINPAVPTDECGFVMATLP
jgi:hypothetical protein